MATDWGMGLLGPPEQGGALVRVVLGQEEAPAAGIKRDKHIRPRGLPSRQESGWGQEAMSSLQPDHTQLWAELSGRR